MVIGVVLAAVILLLFLRNLKVTLIAAVCVPMVLASTVLLLYVLHMSFNIMTLGGMAAAVGLIIDDAIVMVEHVIRRLRGGSGHYRERITAAAAEFTRPLAGSSASTIIIFLPLAFLSGVTGRVLQGAVADDGRQPGHLLPGGLAGRAAAEPAPAAAEGRRPARRAAG